jgi:hypothetical protein
MVKLELEAPVRAAQAGLWVVVPGAQLLPVNLVATAGMETTALAAAVKELLLMGEMAVPSVWVALVHRDQARPQSARKMPPAMVQPSHLRVQPCLSARLSPVSMEEQADLALHHMLENQ